MNERERAILEILTKQRAAGNQRAQMTHEPRVSSRYDQGPRMALQGMTFGWGDELEALIRSMIPNGPEYEKVRDEIREKINTYKTANPDAALTHELVGALAPAALSFAIPGGQKTGAGLLSNAARMAKLGFAGGTVAGSGYSEADNALGLLTDAGAGAVFGTFAAPATYLAMHGAGTLGKGVIDYAMRKFGRTGGEKVRDELIRIAQVSGKSLDEIVQDLQEGRVMADNPLLAFVLKDMVNKGGKAAKDVLRLGPARMAETKATALAGLGKQLAPDADDANVVRWWTTSQNKLKKAASDEYTEIWNNVQYVDDETVDIMQDAIGRVDDESLGVIKRLYRADRLVPLFDIDESGARVLTRRPTAQDAEILRRGLNTATTKAFKNSEGDLGIIYKDLEKSLRKQIDSQFDDIRAVRAKWHHRLAQNEAYETGRKSLNKPIDDLEILIGGYDDDSLRAFRAGLLASLRHKSTTMKKTPVELANESSQLGRVLRTAFPEGIDDDLLKLIENAGNSYENASVLRPTANSVTAGATQAAAASGRVPTGDIVRATTGADVDAATRLIERILASTNKELTDIQRQAVVKTLFSKDPDLVRRMMSDPGEFSRVVKAANAVGRMIGRSANTAATQQSGGYGPQVTGGVKINELLGIKGGF
jgi:hypothetical protein